MYDSVRVKRNASEMKKCVMCEVEKKKEGNFYKSSKGYYLSYCRECCKIQQKENYKKKKEKTTIVVD